MSALLMQPSFILSEAASSRWGVSGNLMKSRSSSTKWETVSCVDAGESMLRKFHHCQGMAQPPFASLRANAQHRIKTAADCPGPMVAVVRSRAARLTSGGVMPYKYSWRAKVDGRTLEDRDLRLGVVLYCIRPDSSQVSRPNRELQLIMPRSVSRHGQRDGDHHLGFKLIVVGSRSVVRGICSELNRPETAIEPIVRRLTEFCFPTFFKRGNASGEAIRARNLRIVEETFERDATL